jgi:transcriptional regulator with XRE-family HTH domain
MEKSVFTEEYGAFLALLRQARKAAGITQVQMAERLAQTQSWISKCERGERRLDIIEVRAFCEVIGIPLPEFSERLETTLLEQRAKLSS